MDNPGITLGRNGENPSAARRKAAGNRLGVWIAAALACVGLGIGIFFLIRGANNTSTGSAGQQEQLSATRSAEESKGETTQPAAKPAPATDNAPNPQSTDAPAPQATDAPAPQATDAPAPQTTDAPAPQVTAAPLPAAPVPATESLGQETPPVDLPPLDAHWYVSREDYYDNGSRLPNRYTVIAYDDRGLKTTESHYLGDGVLDYRTLYEYDSAGFLIRATDYENDGSSHGGTLYENDEAGNCIKRTLYSDDITLWVITAEYDPQQRMIRETWYNSGEKLYKWQEYEYDAAGNRITSTMYVDGEARQRLEYEYDARGNAIRRAEYDREGSLDSTLIYELTFDAQGKLTEQVTRYSNGKAPDTVRYEYINIP